MKHFRGHLRASCRALAGRCLGMLCANCCLLILEQVMGEKRSVQSSWSPVN